MDLPEYEPFFEYMASVGKPIWLHPARGPNFTDYLNEDPSEFEIWWTFGWPYETSAAMARMVFSGLFASDAPFDPEGGPMYIRETMELLDRIEMTDGCVRRFIKTMLYGCWVLIFRK